MSKFLDAKLSSLTPYTPGEQPHNMRELIKLNTNESPFPPSPKVLAALASANSEELRLYPDPECRAFRAAVAERFGISVEQVTAGNGSDELLAFCFHALCENGAVFPDITYGFYEVFCRMFGTSYETVALRDGFELKPDDYSGKRQTVFIANPNAPTGLALPLCEIERLLCQDSSRLVIVDEAYVDFGAESAAPLLSRYDNLLIIGTLSKSRSLAGGRVGYALGSAELISDLELMRFSFNPYNLNRLSLIAGEAAVRDGEYFDNCRRIIAEQRDTVINALRGLGFTVTDSLANFVFAGMHSRISACDYARKLREHGILVRYFAKPRLSDFVRITIGSEAQCSRLIAETKNILDEV